MDLSRGWHDPLLTHSIPLKSGREAYGKAPRGADGVAREETAEVDDVKHIVQVLPVNLKAHLQAFGPVNIRPSRGIYLESWVDAAPVEVNAIEDLLPVFGEDRGRIAIELEGETGVELNSPSDPEAWRDLIAKSSADGVALVL